MVQRSSSLPKDSAQPIRILGIDPGSVVTGYGVIEVQGNHTRYISCGGIRINGDNIGAKMKCVFENIAQVIQEWQPHEASIEQVFLARNADSALKLGQARGAALAALATHDLSIAEYTAKRVKQSVVGKGGASKDQVQHMVKMLLNLTENKQLSPQATNRNGELQADAADALAIALCHAQHRGVLGNAYQGLLATTHARKRGSSRSSSWRNLKIT